MATNTEESNSRGINERQRSIPRDLEGCGGLDVGASVWRFGRTAEYWLMYRKIHQCSKIRKRIIERKK